MNTAADFADYVRRRRRALDLTRTELAARVGCSPDTIKKIEEGERRPSKELAVLLAHHLAIGEAERPLFVAMARGQAAPDPVAPGPSHLPAPLTSFVGRSSEVSALVAALTSEDVRLLTLVGAPGVGKTRLAVRAAGELRPYFPDGVWFVPLATLEDPRLATLTIAHTLGVADNRPASLLDQLTHLLRDRRLLLVLDNFEQLLDAAADLVHLLTACAGLKIMVTSRTPLDVYGEHRFIVSPLPTPPPAEWPSPQRVAAYPAVQLFLARVRAHDADFQLDEENCALIAEVCARLDGLPLAIELAAAQTYRDLPTRLRKQLAGGRRLDLLATTARGLLPRQQTLREAIHWSYRLLSPADQVLFARLGGFAGDFDLDAAYAVAYDPDERADVASGDARFELADRLEALAGHHLIQARTQDGEIVYNLLETLREFALEQLAAHGESGAVRRRHAAYYAAMAQAVDPARTGGDLQEWRALLRRNQANLLAALQWSIGAPEPTLALQLAGGLGHYLYLEGHWQESVHWLQSALAVGDAGEPALRARVLTSLGILYIALGHYAEAERHLTAALGLARRAEDRLGAAWALHQLAHQAILQGDAVQARAYAEDALYIQREMGDPRFLALTLEQLGCAAVEEGNYEEGTPWLLESLEIYLKLNADGGSGSTFNLLGMAALAQGETAQALDAFRRAYAHFERIHHTHGLPWTLRNLGLAQLCLNQPALAQNHFLAAYDRYVALASQDGAIGVVEGIAGVAAQLGQHTLAAHLFGAAAAQRELAGLPLTAN
ncbi:MAG TPA: tetratricopeptide repeat protein, partial [Caldilineaceae bacterium]|nr:tetratricopeptide repeat protein [Caldilineaceae bacterium]